MYWEALGVMPFEQMQENVRVSGLHSFLSGSPVAFGNCRHISGQEDIWLLHHVSLVSSGMLLGSKPCEMERLARIETVRRADKTSIVGCM